MSGRDQLVSAVIPTFNYGRYVTAAVNSALGQTHARLEVIVVDDGSTDDTRERLAPYKGRIQYVYQENRGLSAARNTGIKHSNGEWIAFLDSDDLWHPEKTAIQLSVAQRTGSQLVGGPPASELPRSSLSQTPAVAGLDVRDFLLSARIGPSSALIHRDCFEHVGLFDESLRSIEDRDMWLRISAHYRCRLVESPCWWYRSHDEQMSRRAGRMFANYKQVLSNFFARHPEHMSLSRLAYAYMYCDIAWAYLAEGRNVKALLCLARSAISRPCGLGDSRINTRLRRLKLAARAIAPACVGLH